jgi:transcriptional regulator with XRE-family HTH domain
MMSDVKRKRAEAAGWRTGDAADFLGMTDDERRLLDLRLTVANAVRRLRAARGWTQKDLARALKTSQPRVADIELGARPSLDQMFRAFFAAGGELVNLDVLGKPLTEAEQSASVARPRSRPAATNLAFERPKRTGARKGAGTGKAAKASR